MECPSSKIYCSKNLIRGSDPFVKKAWRRPSRNNGETQKKT